ncbi:MAG: 50S ribosomal protein L19e [Candidatus Hydrothermarchaeales archaeon]
MDLKTQRRLAAKILKVGQNRVWMDEDKLTEVSEAVTRDDVRRLIREGIIRARTEVGVSKYRARKRNIQKAKGRRRGHGKRKGTLGAKVTKKRRWIQTIRPVRDSLRKLRDTNKIDRSTYRKLYMMAKGGIFRSRSHLNTYVKEHKLLRR